MTHFKDGNSHLHTGHPTCFADLTAETIGFQVPVVVPDSDGTASEELDYSPVYPQISEDDTYEQDWDALREADDTYDQDWDALREAEVDDAYFELSVCNIYNSN
jgi:hypothetical protein